MPQITKKDFRKLLRNSAGFLSNAAATYLLHLAISSEHEALDSAEVTANIMGVVILSRIAEGCYQKMMKKYQLDFSSYQEAYSSGKDKFAIMATLDVTELIIKFGLSLGVNACFSRNPQKLFDLAILFASKNIAERVSLRTLNTERVTNNRFMSHLIGAIATYLGGDTFLALKNNTNHNVSEPFTKAIIAGQLIETLITVKIAQARERTLTTDQPYITHSTSAPVSMWNKVTGFFSNWYGSNPEKSPLQGLTR